MMDVFQRVSDMLRPLQMRVANMIVRSVVQRVNDSTKFQEMQLGIFVDDDNDECERVQQYGFTGVPLEGAEAVVLFPNGDRRHPLVICVDDRRFRPTDLEPGEVCTFNNAGASMLHKSDGTTEIGSLGGTHRSLATLESLQSLANIIANAPIVATDGGASFKAALATWTPEGTSRLKGE